LFKSTAASYVHAMTKRALLSVFDKTGIVDFARSLVELGWDLVSSGGTAKVIAEAGIPVRDVAEITGLPAILGHRVVTLHPKIHGGLLADLDDSSHVADLERYGIEPFSLVAVNLYPFRAQPGIEMIDIGGPAMVRAAAKNHAHVGVVVSPSDYPGVLNELRAAGSLSATTRRALARAAFAHTAAYDAEVVTWFDATSTEPSSLPATLHLALEKAQPLRYGENPHQAGARYRRVGATSWWDVAVQHNGKEMSYLNVYDTEAAWRLVNRFSTPAAVVVKHANPCGVAVASSIEDAYRRAHACDPVSAFGGIVALNRPVTAEVANDLVGVFTEVVVAPSFTEDALAVLATKANLRVLSAPAPGQDIFDIRGVDGGLLIQDRDPVFVDRSSWRVVSRRQPTEAEWRDLELGWVVVASVSSNAIVITHDEQAVGIGAGQQNRLDSARIAVEKAADRALGGVASSDAFFPFRDGLDALAASGVTAAIEPGGSMRDADVIAAADEHNMALVFTGERHFKH
jgi:phosphoribosylaminoimidazolecarboxamide formyltransferase / IMP cyclohydrolase